jgi:hypothetical protein
MSHSSPCIGRCKPQSRESLPVVPLSPHVLISGVRLAIAQSRVVDHLPATPAFAAAREGILNGVGSFCGVAHLQQLARAACSWSLPWLVSGTRLDLLGACLQVLQVAEAEPLVGHCGEQWALNAAGHSSVELTRGRHTMQHARRAPGPGIALASQASAQLSGLVVAVRQRASGHPAAATREQKPPESLPAAGQYKRRWELGCLPTLQ